MGREQCQMCQVVGGKVYCDYYDFMYMLCEEQEHCPDGLDDNELEYDEYEDDYDNDNDYESWKQYTGEKI
jgi:hypothetical protein